MGKGDKKSKRGKITVGSFGVRRLRKKTVKKAVAGNKTINVTADETQIPQAAEAKTGKTVKPVKTPKDKQEKDAE